MDIDSIVSFTQEDADEYALAYVDEDSGDVVYLTMHTFEAVRLYNLVVKAMVGYVTEMEIAKASHARGEGPNGEAKGTWEHSRHVDHFACNDPEGDWIEAQRYYADILNKQRKENA